MKGHAGLVPKPRPWPWPRGVNSLLVTTCFADPVYCNVGICAAAQPPALKAC